MAFDINKMTKRELNVGLNDRKIRYGVGSAVLLGSVFLGNILLLLVGSALIASGFTRWCPAYSAMDKTTVDPNEPAPTGGCCGHAHNGDGH